MSQGTPPGDVGAECDRARSSALLFDRSDRGKVVVTGADAGRFLHNLSTNDILHLAPGAGCEAFLATAKAKVVAYLLVFNMTDPNGRAAFWLDAAPGMAAKVVAHLDHFLISEDVQLADRTAELAQFHVAGPRAADVLGQVCGGPFVLDPLGAMRAASPSGECQVRRWDGLGVPGFDVLVPVSGAESLRQALVAAGARPASTETFEWLRVEAGTPLQGADLDENTFVPEVGRAAQAVCYTKGCYLGQEPIVMARDRGHVNRSLLRVVLPDGPVPPGSRLLRDGKEVGRVTSSVAGPGGAVGLAYVRRGSQEPGTALEVEVGGVRRPAVIAPAAGRS
jgi:folate-binding protein YgfZ